MKQRKFTNEEKVRVLEEASKNGVITTLEHYGIYPATYYAWKNHSNGEMGKGQTLDFKQKKSSLKHYTLKN